MLSMSHTCWSVTGLVPLAGLVGFRVAAARTADTRPGISLDPICSKSPLCSPPCASIQAEWGRIDVTVVLWESRTGGKRFWDLS